MKWHFGRAVTLLLAISAGPASAQKTPHFPIVQFALSNGLRVVLSEDHTAPVVGLALAYDVGSRNEVKGRTGFAHLFEHMMFQGSAHVAKSQHSEYIQNAGGLMNGFTRSDDTTFIETVPSEKLPLILWLEADRMRSLAVTAENFSNQKDVVKEEKRRSYDNQPYVRARSIRLQELAYSNFANQHSTIGSMDDLDAASLQDVRAFFTTYYAPNNGVLVLTGDFSPDEVRTLVNRYFGSIPRQLQPPVPEVSEAPQAAEKRDIVFDPLARLPAVSIAWHTPGVSGVDSSDTYALNLLADILIDGDSSRVYQDLVKKQHLIVRITGGDSSRRGPNLFSLFAVFPNSSKPADVEAALIAEVDAIKLTPPSLDELNRVKTRRRADQLTGGGSFGGADTMLGRAIQIADYTVFQNDPNLINTDIKKYMSVTPQQIQAAANKYFTATNRTVVNVEAGAAARGIEHSAEKGPAVVNGAAAK